MNPVVSVVIPTYNRSAQLVRVLDALAGQQGAPPFEVIVVDDGSSDDTQDVLRGRSGVRGLRQANAGPAAARNRGWLASASAIVAFTDDDTVPDPHWVAALAAAMDDPAVVGVGGDIRPLVVTPLARFVDAERHVGHGRQLDGSLDYLVTANAAYRRDVLEACHGFDERFPIASGEDVDLSWRVREAGGRLATAPDAVVLHDHRTTLRQIMRTYRRHGASRYLLRELHPADDLGAAAARAAGPAAMADRWRRYRVAGASRPLSVAFLVLRSVGLGAYGVGLLQARRTAHHHPVPA